MKKHPRLFWLIGISVVVMLGGLMFFMTLPYWWKYISEPTPEGITATLRYDQDYLEIPIYPDFPVIHVECSGRLTCSLDQSMWDGFYKIYKDGTQEAIPILFFSEETEVFKLSLDGIPLLNVFEMIKDPAFLESPHQAYYRGGQEPIRLKAHIDSRPIAAPFRILLNVKPMIRSYARFGLLRRDLPHVLEGSFTVTISYHKDE